MKIKVHNSLINKKSENRLEWNYCLSNILITIPGVHSLVGFFKIKGSMGTGFYPEKHKMIMVSGEIKKLSFGMIRWKDLAKNILTEI